MAETPRVSTQCPQVHWPATIANWLATITNCACLKHNTAGSANTMEYKCDWPVDRSEAAPQRRRWFCSGMGCNRLQWGHTRDDEAVLLERVRSDRAVYWRVIFLSRDCRAMRGRVPVHTTAWHTLHLAFSWPRSYKKWSQASDFLWALMSSKLAIFPRFSFDFSINILVFSFVCLFLSSFWRIWAQIKNSQLLQF